MPKDHAEQVRENYRQQGRLQERQENIDLLLRRVCRDFLKNEYCPHGACEDIRDAVTLLRSKP